MTELYKATYVYETDKEDELSLKVGETVRVSNKENADWWLAERLDNNKEFGLVPSNFLEKISVQEGMVLAIVTKDYLAQDPEELSLQKNRIVAVLDQHIAEGWWKGDLNGKMGVFPAAHVELVEEQSESLGEGDSKSKKDAFKLAAYGVKQGGIGSILAGGFSGLKRSSTRNSMSAAPSTDRPTSTNSTSSHSEVSAPSIPSKPYPSLIKPTESTSPTTNAKKGDASAPTSSRAMVLHDYNPENADEIKLMRGEYVTIVDQLDNNGWWKGVSESDAVGLFPSNFVQILEQDKPPQRPARARPATVKTEAPTSSATSADSSNMAKPPPVPVTTRPTSLLSQRESTNSNNSATYPPPRPTTTPPRPITSPPVPTRRTNSIVSPPAIDVGHRRIPSIPLQSPDLPPMSPVHERPTRPVPRPTSTNSNDSFGIISPSNSTNINQNAINHMAKPPKVNFGGNKPTATATATTATNPVLPPRSPSIGSAPSSRPVSTNEELNRKSINSNIAETLPPVPKRSMPPLPETTTANTGIVPNNFDQAATASTATAIAPTEKHTTTKHANVALPSIPSSGDPLEDKIRHLVQIETEKIRKEFETRLEDERIERLRLQVELEELKNSLGVE